jgi:hypothetical protein
MIRSSRIRKLDAEWENHQWQLVDLITFGAKPLPARSENVDQVGFLWGTSGKFKRV